LDPSTHTYVSMAHGTTSWLDHAVCSADADRLITEIQVLDLSPASDHRPLRISLSVATPALPTSSAGASAGGAPVPGYRWDRASDGDIERYRQATMQRLSAVHLPQETLSCDDPACDRRQHIADIDELYYNICCALQSSSEAVISRASHDQRREHVVPGWNEWVADAHATARNAYVVWRNAGKPRHGAAFDDMRTTRRIFKIAMRRCRSQEETLREEALARSLSQKDCKGFWKQISAMSSAKTPLPTSIDGHTGESAIASMWRSHFHGIMTAVKRDDHRVPVNEALQATARQDLARVSPRMVQHALKKSKKGKACGMDGLAAEHFIYADDIISVLLSMFFNCMLSHCYIPNDFMCSAILPIVKNKTGDTSAKSNYRPVAIVSACSKILESCLMHFVDPCLSTSDNQFGFKSEHSTDMCILALKSVTYYYAEFNSPVYSCFLDASKAFDRVNHWTLFYKLLKRGVSVSVVRLLCFWYRTQKICVRWGKVLSDYFCVTNGVRQGSPLSPKLFALYIDDLSNHLCSSATGCFINDVCTNHFFYADDMCLLAPSAAGLQILLNICSSYGKQHDIAFNSLKSLYLVFKPRRLHLDAPPVFLDGSSLPAVSEAKYLGVFLENDFSDEMEMNKQCSRLYARCNTLLRKFRNCTPSVRKQLFVSYCTNFYCIPLWCHFRQAVFKKVKVAYNNVFRCLFKLDRRCSASLMFTENNVLNFDALNRKCMFDFRSRILSSSNRIISELLSNFYVRFNDIFGRWRTALYSPSLQN
jgi:hypothetical protein